MTADASPQPAPVRWYQLGIADIALVLFCVGIIQVARASMVDDPSLGWQLRIPDAMWETGGFLYADPFSETAAGQPWVPYGFIASGLFRLSDAWGGIHGIAVLTTLVLAWMLRCLFRMLTADGIPAPLALFWTFLAALGASGSFVARPNVFTLFFLLITARVCERFHRGALSWKRTLWLLPLFAVWANTHGGFAAGLATLGFTALIEAGLAVFVSARRQAALGRCRWMLALTAGAGAATLLNPYGWGLHLWVLRTMQDPAIMNLNLDWLSPDFHAPGAWRLELLILLFPLLLAVSRRRPNAVALGLALFWLHGALNGRRFGAVWVVVATPLLARLSAETVFVRRLSAFLSGRDQALSGAWNGPRPQSAPILWSVVFSLVFLASSRWAPYARHTPEMVPEAVLNKLLEVHHGEKVFNNINWGGYLIWHGWTKSPRLRTWIDDRNEIFSRAQMGEYDDLMETRPGWNDVLRRDGIGLVCIEPDTPLAARLQETPGWEEVCRDRFAVLFRLKDAGTDTAREAAAGPATP